MNWDPDLFGTLTRTVYRRHNESFWNDPKGWVAHLSSLGIERCDHWDSAKLENEIVSRAGTTQADRGARLICIPCPLSNKMKLEPRFGRIGIHRLFIPERLAEKIVVLGEMP